MLDALTAALMASLLLSALVRAARPGGLLAFLAGYWQAWLVRRPVWLPGNPTGDCALCTCFWLPGLPVAVLVALHTPAGWWALTVPFLVAVLAELLLP